MPPNSDKERMHEENRALAVENAALKQQVSGLKKTIIDNRIDVNYVSAGRDAIINIVSGGACLIMVAFFLAMLVGFLVYPASGAAMSAVGAFLLSGVLMFAILHRSLTGQAVSGGLGAIFMAKGSGSGGALTVAIGAAIAAWNGAEIPYRMQPQEDIHYVELIDVRMIPDASTKRDAIQENERRAVAAKHADRCPTGQQFLADRCSDIFCKEGWKLDGSACVLDCPDDTTRVDGVCVLICPPGKKPAGDKCEDEGEPFILDIQPLLRVSAEPSEGDTKENCLRPSVKCLPGQELKMFCQQRRCPMGQTLVDRGCKPICSEGQEMDARGNCQCFKGQVLLNGKCGKVQCPQGQVIVPGGEKDLRGKFVGGFCVDPRPAEKPATYIEAAQHCTANGKRLLKDYEWEWINEHGVEGWKKADPTGEWTDNPFDGKGSHSIKGGSKLKGSDSARHNFRCAGFNNEAM